MRDDDEEEDEPCLEEDIGIFDDSHSDGDEAQGHDEEESVGGGFDGLVEEVPQGEELGRGGIVVGEVFELGFEREEEEGCKGQCDGDGGEGKVEDGVERFGEDDAENKRGAADEDGCCFADCSVGDAGESFGGGGLQGGLL